MHILLTGGGTGGHIIPLLAVAHELKSLDPSIRLSYVGERGGKFAQLTSSSELFEDRASILAGKFRRYHGESWLRRLLDIRTNLLNIRDGFKVAIGFFQAVLVLRRLRPNAVFVKGGFVGVPVGLAAALLNIPIVTHDSDSVPGLANRIVARWAYRHATGMPAELYPYPRETTVFVGVPVASDFQPATPELVVAAKQQLQLPKDAQLLLVTGGSQGSTRINEAVRRIVTELLDRQPQLHIVHHVGYGNEEIYSGTQHERLHVEPFIDQFAVVLMAADVVVTRGGANSLAELGVVGKPAIVVPSPFLTGGHQLENAKHLAEKHAVVVVQEVEMQDKPALLMERIETLLTDRERAAQLAANLQKVTKTGAARQLAELLVEAAK